MTKGSKDDITDRILAQMDKDAAERAKNDRPRTHFFGLPVSNDPFTQLMCWLFLVAIVPYIIAMGILIGSVGIRAALDWWNTPKIEIKELSSGG